MLAGRHCQRSPLNCRLSYKAFPERKLARTPRILDCKRADKRKSLATLVCKI